MFWEAYHSLCLKIKKSSNAVAKEIGCSSGAVYDTLALNVFEYYARREIINRRKNDTRVSLMCRGCVGIVSYEIVAFSEKFFAGAKFVPFVPFYLIQ